MAETERDELADLRTQLEQLRRECARSADMTAEIIAAFGEVFRRERRVDVLSLESGRTILPLGVKDQRIAVGPVAAAGRVCATALCADASEVIMLRLTVGRFKDQCVRDVVGKRINEPSEDGATFLVRLIAGEPKNLFEIVPHADATEFAVCRVGGDPCIVRLQVVNETAEVATSATAGSAARSVAGAASCRERTSRKGALWRAQELLREGRSDRAVEVALAYATDAESPALALVRATLAKDDDEWLANVNAYVERFGIAPVRLKNANAPRFLRLAADVPRAVIGGPLVTVVMPAYNAEKTLELAATSILNQTWANIELIIVDDCSADATWSIARRLADLDRRTRVHKNNANVGPYVSKNLALSMANGSYITCHDADDWAHPQRIEKQMEPIVASDGRARACVASWLRLDESGRFCGFTAVGRQSFDGALRVAHVTCMIEAEFMRRFVGHWDSVRFGADGEMLERLERVLGDGFLRLSQLSVFSLDTPGSLTNDSVHGISQTGMSPTRRAYRDAWRQWHATVTSDSAYMEFPQFSRPFVAPDVCVVPTSDAELVCAN